MRDIINAPVLTPRSNNATSRTAVIVGVVIGSVVLVAMTGGILFLLSRKERAKRKHAQQRTEQLVAVQVPPAYKADLFDAPAGFHPAQRRPLSSFAPDYSRQSQYYHRQQQHQHQQQYDWTSDEQPPPPYPTLPAYDPSRYQPMRPTSTASADLHSYVYGKPASNQSSRLSAIHYDSRSSVYRPSSVADQYQYQYQYPAPVPARPREILSSNPRPLSILPYHAGALHEQNLTRQPDGRERSVSEPMPPATVETAQGPRRPKPVLSRLITNF
ncbi:hypothetical protein NUU61_005382 [Penicillium alfredii]|uniref:Uncharacterized protein n=1 Tax=Penicillium alfredii TaxID=1506179 RepID=A0A9W9F9G0_9EURO|nr:uncharacterized protein NUU61_005382 [Penicillium alfredii]KAJ5096026.1 hypothetical protein NUU61_005382 [Penicillium alfredii]